MAFTEVNYMFLMLFYVIKGPGYATLLAWKSKVCYLLFVINYPAFG